MRRKAFFFEKRSKKLLILWFSGDKVLPFAPEYAVAPYQRVAIRG
jgi:hypothetical protein